MRHFNYLENEKIFLPIPVKSNSPSLWDCPASRLDLENQRRSSFVIRLICLFSYMNYAANCMTVVVWGNCLNFYPYFLLFLSCFFCQLIMDMDWYWWIVYFLAFGENGNLYALSISIILLSRILNFWGWTDCVGNFLIRRTFN